MGVNGRIGNQVRFIFDDAGRVAGYRNPVSDQDEALPSTLEGYQSPSGSTWRTMQDAINTYGQVTLPEGTQLTIANPVLLGNDCVVNMNAGTYIYGAGDTFHSLFRTGNAEWADFGSAAAGGIFGVFILCADQASSTSSGQIRYTHAGTTLAYAGPGAAFGAGVDISAVVSAATERFYVLTDSRGQSIYVRVAVNANRTANATKDVRIEPVTGAVPITWTRAANVVTVTEVGHKRCGGHFVQLFGALQGHFFILTTTTDTWTIASTGANTGATAGRVFGVRNVIMNCAGAQLDYQKTAFAGGGRDNLYTHSILMLAVSGVYGTPPNTKNTQKYALYCHGVFDVDLWDLQYEDAGSDGLHITGPARKVCARNITGKNGDNMTAIGTSDYSGHFCFAPTAGTVEVTYVRLSNLYAINTNFEPCRIYAAASAYITDVVVDGVFGTWAGAVSAPVQVMTDGTSNDGTATNIDGLVVRNVRCYKADGTANPMVQFNGTGTRRNIRVERQQLQPISGTASGTVVVNSSLEDLAVEFEDGLAGFCGAGVDVRGTFTVKHLTVTGRRLRADNTLNAATQPMLVLLEASTSVVSHLDISGVDLADVSAGGTKAALIYNKGTLTTALVQRVKLEACESLLRASSTAATTTILRVDNAEVDASFVAVVDAAIARLQLTNVHATGTVLHLNATGNVRLVAVACTFDARFLRNVAGNSSIWVKAVGCIAGTPLQIDAGAPLVKADGDWDMALDGALLDATLANHAPGAKFYNTNAAFGAGVGAYARGAAAWVRIAA